MKRHFRLAVAQVGGISVREERREVVSRLNVLLDQAHASGASFVVYPELTFTTFFPRYWKDDIAEFDSQFEREMPNSEVQSLFDRARRYGIGFYIGYAELTSDGHRYNSAVVVNSKGEVAGKYRKIHLPGHSDNQPTLPSQHLEKRYFEVGDLGFGVFEVDNVQIGMCLCNDRRWPEVYRVLALQNADLIVLGYNTPKFVPGWEEEPHAKMFTHLLSLQAGAYQSSAWVAAAAKCGYEDGHYMIGGSAVVAPSGEIVAKARGDSDELVVADVDLDLALPYRQSVFDFTAHRKPEWYKLITERTGRGSPEHRWSQGG